MFGLYARSFGSYSWDISWYKWNNEWTRENLHSHIHQQYIKKCHHGINIIVSDNVRNIKRCGFKYIRLSKFP